MNLPKQRVQAASDSFTRLAPFQIFELTSSKVNLIECLPLTRLPQVWVWGGISALRPDLGGLRDAEAFYHQSDPSFSLFPLIPTAFQPLQISLGIYPEPRGLQPWPPAQGKGSQQMEGNQIPVS